MLEAGCPRNGAYRQFVSPPKVANNYTRQLRECTVRTFAQSQYQQQDSRSGVEKRFSKMFREVRRFGRGLRACAPAPPIGQSSKWVRRKRNARKLSQLAQATTFATRSRSLR